MSWPARYSVTNDTPLPPTSNVFFPAWLITGQGFFLRIEGRGGLIEGGEVLHDLTPA